MQREIRQTIKDWATYSWPAQNPDIIEKGGFTVANLSVTKEPFQTERDGGLSITGEVRNLTDKDYSYVKSYPMPGRSYFVSMRYTF